MQYVNNYESPIGKIILTADDEGLTGLWFDGAKYSANYLDKNHIEKDLPVFDNTKHWLDIYFTGQKTDFTPSIHMIGSDFQIDVWKILLDIPYGETTTYGDIAKQIASQRNLSTMSAQAVGGAVSHNKISIIIPCHRVIGSNGNLTGYAGGINRKIKLLTLEKVDMQNIKVDK